MCPFSPKLISYPGCQKTLSSVPCAIQYIIAFAVLALLYWILTLRTWPVFRMQTTTPPEGITAGELGCRLTLSGGDLTMMVFSWAQLGYLYIALDDRGRVLLHKRMDMGNERSKFENSIYKMLFSNRSTVDAPATPMPSWFGKFSGSFPRSGVCTAKIPAMFASSVHWPAYVRCFAAFVSP